MTQQEARELKQIIKEAMGEALAEHKCQTSYDDIKCAVIDAILATAPTGFSAGGL